MSLNDFDEPEIHSEIETMRHSCAHVMAHAIQKLWPTAKFGIGPTVENGFYYDVDLPVKLTPEDLPKIEKEMTKLIAAKAVMQRFPEMWKHLDTRTDEELQARLIVDDKYNIMITSKYLLILGINHSPEHAILSYNVGQSAASNIDPSSNNYVRNVKNHSKNLVYWDQRIQVKSSKNQSG